ncbi:MAG: hypothetical protein RLZZ267_1259 [Bacillota bacterium]|jgi:tRNA(Ile)-lysidine synthase TilS/MesJ
MAVHDVKEICQSSRVKLKAAIEAMEAFLNVHNLSALLGETKDDAEMTEFYQGFLSDLRHLSVFSEVSYEKLGNLLRRPELKVDHAEKVLYDTYHNAVNAFFYPKHECYSEDGRYAYTGQDAIRFRKKPVRAARDIILQLSKSFEQLREELAFYETDYVTQKRLQGERV